jgi:hypothetical protein
MQHLVQGTGLASPREPNVIKVCCVSDSVSYQQGDCCIVYALSSIQVVKASGLPPTFITVQQAMLASIFSCWRRRLSYAIGDPFPAPHLHLYRAPQPSAMIDAYSKLTQAQYLLLLTLSHARLMLRDDEGAFMHQEIIKSKKPLACLTAWLTTSAFSLFLSSSSSSIPLQHKKQRR